MLLYYKKIYDIRQLLISSALIGCTLFHPLFMYPNNDSFTIQILYWPFEIANRVPE